MAVCHLVRRRRADAVTARLHPRLGRPTCGGPFVQHVTWMRDEVDARGPALPPVRQTAMQQLFEQAIAAEISFHDAPYDR